MGLEYLTMTEAREYLGVSKPKMWRLVKRGILPFYLDPRDNRRKLINKADLDNLKLPKGVKNE